MFCLKKKLSGLTNSRSFFNHVDFSGLVPKGGCKFLLLLGDSKVPLQMAKLRNQNSPEFGINKFILIPIWGLSLLEQLRNLSVESFYLTSLILQTYHLSQGGLNGVRPSVPTKRGGSQATAGVYFDRSLWRMLISEHHSVFPDLGGPSGGIATLAFTLPSALLVWLFLVSSAAWHHAVSRGASQ